MSLVQTEITLKNAHDKMKAEEGLIKKTDVRKMTVMALVDTGAWTLVINEAVRKQLGLEKAGIEEGTLADGSKTVYDMAGPLEAMDLTVNPRRELVGAHGNTKMHPVKGCCYG